jgi:signal transduction histidine kinase
MGIEADSWVVFLALLIPGTVVYFYLLRLDKRLKKLIKGTDNLARGNYERIFFLDPTDELGKIAGKLNRISRQMENLAKERTQEFNKMEAILGGITEGVIVLDQFGKIMLINCAAEKIFNCRQEEVKLTYLINLLKNQELLDLIGMYVMENSLAVFKFTLEQRTLQIQVSPVLGKEGYPRGTVIICSDITEPEHSFRKCC